MTYNEKKEITWYLERNGYESHNGIKYIKKYHGGDTVVSVTVLAVGNKEYSASAVCRTVLRLTGDIGGSVELTMSRLENQILRGVTDEPIGEETEDDE